MVNFPKFTPGQTIHKVGGRYGGPGRYVGDTMALDADGYKLYSVAMKVEGGYGEFIHVFPASALSDTPDPRTPLPPAVTESELVEALRRLVKTYDGFEDGDGEPCPDVAFAKAALANIGKD
jgi:hypothetical protein